jgi:methylated-DNA-[protein]-cysteine S-methyltransferase
VSGKAVAAVPAPGQTGRVFLWTVMPAPGPIGALTVGATADGLALVAFGDHPEAAAQSAERLGVAAQGPMRLPEARLDAERAEAVAIPAVANGATAVREQAVVVEQAAAAPIPPGAKGSTGRSAAVRERAVAVDRAQTAPTPAVGAVLERAAAQLREYFVGERRVFDVPLDWSLTRGSQRRVLGTLFATVGYGETVTYGELAARSELGSAYTAARGVGAIMGSNPLPVVVPCHRVMAADGLGGFGGGRATKEWLLAHEGVLTGALDFG